MAKMEVTRSDGQIVELVLAGVDRQKDRVAIKIPAYNALFIFTRGGSFAVLTTDGRQALNQAEKAILHVSKSVYQAMAVWAWAILIDPRD